MSTCKAISNYSVLAGFPKTVSLSCLINIWCARSYELIIKDNFTAPAKDDEWFTMHIIVKDKTIVAKVNDKVISEWVEPADWTPPKNFAGRKLSSGTIAIQGHDPGSEVHYRKIELKPLP